MKKILVTGDLSTDLVKSKYISDTKTSAWDFDGYTISKLDGGAILLAKMIAAGNNSIKIVGYDQKKINKKIRAGELELIELMVHAKPFHYSMTDVKSKIRLHKYSGFKKPEDKDKVKIPVYYSVVKYEKNVDDPNKNHFEFKWSEKYIEITDSGKNKPYKLTSYTIEKQNGNVIKQNGKDYNPDIVVIHDSGNKYRCKKELPDYISQAKFIFYKMARPLVGGDLWKLMQNKELLDKLILIINANDLRDEEGLRITRSLSWERTAHDFYKQVKAIEKDSRLQSLLECKDLILHFETDGAIHYQKIGNKPKITLYFDPEVFEGDLNKKYPGYMCGLRLAFFAGLISGSTESDKDELKLDCGIKKGLLLSQNLHKLGLKELKEKNKKSGQLEYPFEELFKNTKEIENVISVDVPKNKDWKILYKTLENDKCIYNAASEFVKTGKKLNAPIAQFGKLITADRNEIESYHSIKNLMQEYLKKPTIIPLSIAVFGYPGSGKSFGVKQIAKTISENIETKEYNLSQFQSPKDLLDAFHIVQSISLSGKIPLVIFDEFDCNLDKERYGWLKYFLSPMNDGEFKLGESTHPIGKSIFLFTGGTSNTFQEFNPVQDVKGPDFKSRLRGYVNIEGVNRYNFNSSILQSKRCFKGFPSKNYDNFYMIRRAMVLRGNLEEIAPNIFKEDSKGNKIANIDECVLNALLKVPIYEHGIRSMRAIIEMSQLSNKKKFQRSALPSSQQLEMHVDPIEFKAYLEPQIYEKMNRNRVEGKINNK